MWYGGFDLYQNCRRRILHNLRHHLPLQDPWMLYVRLPGAFRKSFEWVEMVLMPHSRPLE